MWLGITLFVIVILVIVLIIIANNTRERLVREMQIEYKHCVVCKYWKRDSCPNSFDCFSGDTKKYFEVEE